MGNGSLAVETTLPVIVTVWFAGGPEGVPGGGVPAGVPGGGVTLTGRTGCAGCIGCTGCILTMGLMPGSTRNILSGVTGAAVGTAFTSGDIFAIGGGATAGEAGFTSTGVAGLTDAATADLVTRF